MVDKIDNGMKQTDLLKDEVDHCFTSECLRVVFIMISDFFVFRNNLRQKCACNDVIFDHCICLTDYVKTLRSFSFEKIENDKLPVEYEKSRRSLIDEIIKQM